MRIVTWNVNGIKTLLQYHPWNKKRTYEGIIEDLGGDITCIQETKITRAQMDKGMAVMDKYDSFFSFYRKTVRGIHGTAIFTKRDVVVPLKAEEGIGSAILPAQLTASERIGGYPMSSEVDLEYGRMKELDNEGRTTIIDTGMFVLINLYCPNETNEERLVFKNDFNTMVDRRVRNLIKEGREVIVVGDLNICASDLDTAEPDQRARDQGLENFTDHPPRKWLQEFVGPGGPVVDTTRARHPDRKAMYTCWNTKIDARPSNYGTRLDYILVTRGMLPWIKDADIQRDIVGSDHCPVYLDLHDSIEIPGRGVVHLKDELKSGRTSGDAIPEPPPFACRFYDEFSGKQKTLASFFGRGAASKTPSAGPSPSPQPTASTSKLPPPPAPSATSTDRKPQEEVDTKKKKKEKGKALEIDQPVEKKKGQQTLGTFFRPPPLAQTSDPEPKSKKRKKSTASSSSSGSSADQKKGKSTTPEGAVESLRDAPPPPPPTIDADARPEDDDIIFVDDDLSSASPCSQQTASQAIAEINSQAKTAWQSMLAPKAVPRCSGHNEPMRLWTVNKTGLNKGRKFYLCARPVGPGYDKGQAKINVNPEFRCDDLQWLTNVTRPAGLVEKMNSKKPSK